MIKEYLVEKEDDFVEQIHTFALADLLFVENLRLYHQLALLQVGICVVVLYIQVIFSSFM